MIQTERTLKIGRSPARGKAEPSGRLVLRGQWLTEWGFTAGDKVHLCRLPVPCARASTEWLLLNTRLSLCDALPVQALSTRTITDTNVQRVPTVVFERAGLLPASGFVRLEWFGPGFVLVRPAIVKTILERGAP